ncbi:hypothetical protein BC629DRAFT_245266 [Irpex lacteus]|nr:hypothetical protein BC629DRAFT_245266 [Irpex lacteus]
MSARPVHYAIHWFIIHTLTTVSASFSHPHRNCHSGSWIIPRLARHLQGSFFIHSDSRCALVLYPDRHSFSTHFVALPHPVSCFVIRPVPFFVVYTYLFHSFSHLFVITRLRSLTLTHSLRTPSCRFYAHLQSPRGV